MAGVGQAFSIVSGFSLVVMLALFLVSCGGSTHSPPQIPSLQGTDATQPSDKDAGAAGPGSGGGGGGGGPLDGSPGGAYATTLGDLFTGEMPVLGPVVGSVVAPLPGGGSTQVNVIEDFDPFTVMYQALEDGRIIVTNRDLTLGLERPEEVWPTEIWVDPETQESWEVYNGRLLATFDSTVTTSQLETLFEENEFEVDFSWFEPLPNEAGNDFAWFHLTFEGELQSKLDELSALPCVVNVNPLFTSLIEAHYAPPDDPFYVDGDCRQLDALNVVPTPLVPLPPPYSNQIVAVFDSGVLASHPDLKDKVTNVDVFAFSNEYLVINNHRLPPSHWCDHGTLVAGMVAAATNNATGVACCAPRVKVLPVRIDQPWQPRHQYFDLAAIATAVRAMREVFPHSSYGPYFWQQHVRVVNISIGEVPTGEWFWLYYQISSEIARDNFLNDRLYAASAGNDADEIRVYPASFPNVLGVSGAVPNHDLDEWYMRTLTFSGSNYMNDGYSTYPVSGIYGFRNPWLRVAQGSTGYSFNFITNQFQPEYRQFFGTSACAPQVCALAALLYTIRPTATRWEVEEHMKTYHHIYDPDNPDYNPHDPIAPIVDFNRALANW